MENASKAVLFAASVIITIMLLSMMVYLFRRFGDTASTTEKKMTQTEIDAFNSKFVNYDTGGEHSKYDRIMFRMTGNDYTYDKVLEYSRSPSYQYYNQALIAISVNLNNVSDIVSAVNDAIDVNYKNNNGYRYNNLEVQNSIEIIVDMGNIKNEFSFNKNYQYLIVEPNPNIKPKFIYGSNSINVNKEDNVNLDIFKEDNEINVYDMLEELRTTKVIKDEHDKMYTVYKYYFFGEVIKNEFTGLIETVKFTLIKDRNF